MFIFHNKKITNALKFVYQWCSSTATDEGDHPLGYHGVSSSNVGVSALAQHLLNFEITSQVPDGLSKHVTSSKKTQSNWYRKLLKAWRATNPPPRTPEEASWLVIRTLQGRKNVDLEGLLSFYGLSYPARVECTTSETPQPNDGLKFVLHTLPVDARAVPDGDGITVYVSTSDSRESSLVPQEVHTATVEHNKARAERNFLKANSLKKQIIDAGYGFLHINNEEILARKYRIRLRGIDAPENAQSHGKEAKDELVKIIGGKCLKIEVYDEDQYGRFVGDVFCDGIFVQKLMLKNGLAWHYITYDKRPQLAKWEKAARARRLGLWASPNPEKPWEWRKNHREQRNQSQ